MKQRFALLVVIAVLSITASAQDATVKAPKPNGANAYRIMLYVVGSPRVIEYLDATKIYRSDSSMITFETADGFVVVHNGPYTIVQPKASFAERIR